MSSKPSASIAKLVFSGGNEFLLAPNEKVILVGPNNSGKSQSLREILSFSNSDNELCFILKSVNISRLGTQKDLRDFFSKDGDFTTGTYRYRDWAIPETHLQFWDRSDQHHLFMRGFIKKVAADDRLMICEQQKSIEPGQQKSKPQHILYDDEALTKKVSALFKRAFGKDIMFDFRGGSRLPIHVGNIPNSEIGTDRVSDAYVKAVRENPLLDRQGDGMKSYAGILFETIAASRDITLIDEPEAFLHPPQMRRLGETLASEVTGQLIVATHSSDIMRGFLEGTKGNVRILRIRREGNVNLVSEALPAVIKELWEKPELRFSNALEGIFHEQTIICEDDSDCRLINSIADHMSANAAEPWQDTAYVPTGGKHGIPKVASVLRKIGVPVKAVFDIDFLAERELVESTVIAFGGDWALVEPLWNRVDAAVRKGIMPKSIAEIKIEITNILGKTGDDELPRGDVIEAMKQGKSWATVKKFGTQAIPPGNVQRDYNDLQNILEEIGIFLVPVGEMECFCREIGLHGPKFVTKLLTEIPLSDERLINLRSFVERVQKGKHGKL
jgi:hypothetical protein